MCLSSKRELNKEQLNGFKVLIEQDDGYHAIKNNLDKGALKSNKQYTAIGDGFSVFYNRDDAEQLKNFLIKLLDRKDNDGTLNRNGQPVIKKINGKDIFTQGWQIIDESYCNSDKPINAFKCKKIKVVL